MGIREIGYVGIDRTKMLKLVSNRGLSFFFPFFFGGGAGYLTTLSVSGIYSTGLINWNGLQRKWSRLD
jgi:hypothetical protein